jgi:hypothetical protein
MAYKMTEITPQVRVGQNREGAFNVEIWTPCYADNGAELEQVFIPADAASDLGKYLMLKSAP